MPGRLKTVTNITSLEHFNEIVRLTLIRVLYLRSNLLKFLAFNIDQRRQKKNYCRFLG